jgi:hypothetical protein
MQVASAKQRAFIIPSGDGVNVISFDTVIREAHTSELTVTDNPVETGVVISDHAFMMPLKLEIEAAVGDVWLHAARTDAADPFADPVRQADPFADPLRNTADPFASSASRSQVALAALQEIQAASEPFTVQTGLRAYSNMLITSLSAEQDKDTSAFLLVRMSLREVLRVSTQTVVYPKRKAGKTAHQASPSVTAGEKQAPEVVGTAKREGILYSMLGLGDSSAEVEAKNAAEVKAIAENPVSSELKKRLGPGS